MLEFLKIALMINLILLSICDKKTGIIPPKYTSMIMIIGIISTAIKEDGRTENIIGCIIGLIICAIVFMTDEKFFGGGDAKLLVGAGLYLGWDRLLISILLACYSALIVYGCKFIFFNKHNLERTIRFGPYLSLGIIATIIYEKDIVHWFLFLL
ncbi:MAG: hypothetical protein ATN31_03370 [Candidatus Epulonipiscioides saccharophilum]|nr:MAG: hypothetical protein ATN31_03370 [Epulopiscium sp. AS2M-Bin001]